MCFVYQMLAGAFARACQLKLTVLQKIYNIKNYFFPNVMMKLCENWEVTFNLTMVVALSLMKLTGSSNSRVQSETGWRVVGKHCLNIYKKKLTMQMFHFTMTRGGELYPTDQLDGVLWNNKKSPCIFFLFEERIYWI